MNAQRRLGGVILVAIFQAELRGHSEIHLVGRNREFAANRAPDLHVDLRAVKRGFVRHLDEIDAGSDQHFAHHVLGFFPQLRFVDVFLAQTFGRGSAEAHLIFFQSEDFEIFQIHVVDGAKLFRELVFGAINVGVVHVERADAHEAEQLARLFVAIAGAVFG